VSVELPTTYPHYSPDGNFLIYSTWSSHPDRIWKIPRIGGVPSPLTPIRSEDDAYGDISPDGRWLAFARIDKAMTRVYVAPVEGGTPRLLTPSPSTIPRWSPDGRWITFSPDRGFTSGVFLISSDGSNEQRLTNTGGWPVWWPDGKRIAYISVKPDGNQQIQTVDVKTGVIETLSQLQFEGTNFTFDVSRNGQFVTTNSIHLATEIWIMEPKP
jgi:TolB protein